MDQMKLLLEEHRKGAFIALSVLLVFVGLSVTRCVSVQESRAQGGDTAVQEHAAGENTDTEAALTPEEAARAKLTDEQRQRQASYDDDTQALVDSLTANLWVARNDTYYIEFSDTTYTDHSTSATTVHPYVVSALQVATPSASGEEVTTAAIETDEGTYLLTYRKGKNAGGTEVTSISSDAFEIGAQDSYTRTAAVSGKISVVGLNSEIEAILRGQTSEMVKQIEDFCAENFPSATEAAWEGYATCDWTTSTILTTFVLNNSAKSQISVEYSTDSSTFSVSSGYTSR